MLKISFVKVTLCYPGRLGQQIRTHSTNATLNSTSNHVLFASKPVMTPQHISFRQQSIVSPKLKLTGLNLNTKMVYIDQPDQIIISYHVSKMIARTF